MADSDLRHLSDGCINISITDTNGKEANQAKHVFYYDNTNKMMKLNWDNLNSEQTFRVNVSSKYINAWVSQQYRFKAPYANFTTNVTRQDNMFAPLKVMPPTFTVNVSNMSAENNLMTSRVFSISSLKEG